MSDIDQEDRRDSFDRYDSETGGRFPEKDWNEYLLPFTRESALKGAISRWLCAPFKALYWRRIL